MPQDDPRRFGIETPVTYTKRFIDGIDKAYYDDNEISDEGFQDFWIRGKVDNTGNGDGMELKMPWAKL